MDRRQVSIPNIPFAGTPCRGVFYQRYIATMWRPSNQATGEVDVLGVVVDKLGNEGRSSMRLSNGTFRISPKATTFPSTPNSKYMRVLKTPTPP